MNRFFKRFKSARWNIPLIIIFLWSLIWGTGDSFTVEAQAALVRGETHTRLAGPPSTRAAGALSTEYWSMYGHGSAHTSASSVNGPNSPDLAWVYPDEIVGDVVVGPDGTIYGSSYDPSILRAVNPDGTLKWEWPAGFAETINHLAVVDNAVYAVGSITSSTLYAFSPTDGSVLWTYPIHLVSYSNPTIGSDGTIYIASQLGDYHVGGDHDGGYLYAIRPDGTLKWIWNSNTPNCGIESSAAIGPNGDIYIQHNCRGLVALDSNGQFKWERGGGELGQPFNSPSVGPDGTIYIGSSDYTFRALNPDGSEKWQATVDGWMYDSSSAISADGSTIYRGDNSGGFYAFDSQGSVKWKFESGWGIMDPPTISANGIIYFTQSLDSSAGPDDKAYLYALRATDGTLIWKYELGESGGTPVLGPDGTLYVTRQRPSGGWFVNELYAFRCADGVCAVPTPPGAFGKTTPANGATEQPTSPVLSWNSSTDATFYEYCYDTTNDNACSNWTNNGTSTSKSLSGLSQNKTYYWHVRAVNSAGITYANDSPTAFWSFTTAGVPVAFNKSSPTFGANRQPLNPTLTWGSSVNATSYEYCYDTTNDNACSSWINNGTSTSKTLSGLSQGTNYYWHVRANNALGTTYSDGASTGYWLFTTGSVPSGFNKIGPANGATNQPANVTLIWQSSSNITAYEYCYDTTDDDACSGWISNGTSTSKTLSGLSQGTTYYWHVRANNSFGNTYSDGSSAAVWSFTTDNTSNSNLILDPSFEAGSPNPYWDESSTNFGTPLCEQGTTYCPGGAARTGSFWGWFGGTDAASEIATLSQTVTIPAGSSASLDFYLMMDQPGAGSNAADAFSVLVDGTTLFSTNATQYTSYPSYTAVRVDVSAYSDGAAHTILFRVVTTDQVVSFHVDDISLMSTSISAPGELDKLGPPDGSSGQPTSPTISWEPSSGASSYGYCYDTSDDDLCSNWTNNGTATSKTLSGLSPNTTYYWHVRAVNAGGTTYSNGSEAAFWSFTTIIGAPATFSKSTPTDGATDQPTSLTLSWESSTSAASYQYCYDVSNDNACSNWTNNGTATSKMLSGLSPNTTYYWHVRASNAGGTTYSNGSDIAFWSFTTRVDPPGPFNKSAPVNGAMSQSLSPTLSWLPSPGATSYEYCYDTTADGLCSAWIDNGTATSVTLSGLSFSTTYYWHVRALNSASIIYSNGSATAFWQFTTEALVIPGVPVLLSPPPATSLRPTFDWKDSKPAADHYQLQVSTNSAFTALAIDEPDIPVSTFIPTADLIAGKLYYWRVRAFNVMDQPSRWSTAWTFKTPLSQPVLVSPTEAEPLTSDRPTFEWNVVDGATSYNLQVSALNNFSTLLVNATISTPEYAVTKDLPQNKTLYWRVRAKTPAMTSPWSVKWSFKTGNPPTVPVLVAPAKGALIKDYTPVFNWNNSTRPAGTTFKYYEIQVDDAKDFSSPVINTTTTLGDIADSEFTPLSDLASNTRFYWRVRAVNTVNAVDHMSGWSTVWSFRTVVLPPAGLTVIPNGLKPSFEWDDAAAPFTGYTIQISTSASFSTFIVNSTTINSTYTMLKNLPAGKTIYWRVRVNGPNGPSAWSKSQLITP